MSTKVTRSNLLAADERGVTPVIGVILVVALTVILAALVGTNALGLANHSATSAPNVGFHAGWQATADGNAVNDRLVVEHQSGGAIETARISVVVDGVTVYDGGTAHPDVTVTGWDGEKISAGDTIVVTENGADDVFEGKTYAVYYEWDGRSFVLSEDESD